VSEQTTVLGEQIRNGLKPPSFGSDPRPLGALETIQFCSSLLAEWAGLLERSGAETGARFFERNALLLASPLAVDLLDKAVELNKALLPYAGLKYIVHLSISQSVEYAVSFMRNGGVRHDLFVTLQAGARGQDLLEGGLANVILDPQEASGFFYAALGAEIAGNHELAVSLMRLSGREAGQVQREQGRVTIQRDAARLQWSDEVTADLLRALGSEPSE